MNYELRTAIRELRTATAIRYNRRRSSQLSPEATIRLPSIMHLIRGTCTFALLLLSIGAAAQRAGGIPPDPPLPEPGPFFENVRQTIRMDYELQKGFRYREHRRDVKISKLGKVTVGPLRTFEVYPSTRPGGTYKRLIAIEGKPLDAAELARRDAEREQQQREAAERAKAETLAQRAERLAEEARERQEREAIIQDALAVYEATITGRQRHDGRSVIVVDLSPRSDARVSTREGRWMLKFAGRAWFDESSYQIAKLHMKAIDDVSIGWGILGRVHEGSRFTFTRRHLQGAWLPAEVEFAASGRTLLFRRFDFHVVTTYSDYRKVESPAGSDPG